MARDTLSTYLNINETFKIHTNVRAFQLEAVFVKKGKPIDITGIHQRYTVTEK